jgi:hypothetical protein
MAALAPGGAPLPILQAHDADERCADNEYRHQVGGEAVSPLEKEAGR